MRVRAGRGATALVAVVVAVVGAITGPVPTAGAQTDQYLSVSSVSGWVEADGTWSVSWTIDQDLPADATLRSTIHKPLATKKIREAFEQVVDGNELGATLTRTDSVAVSTLRTDSGVAWSLPIRSGPGDAQRTLVPNPGVHPIEIELDDAAGTPLQRFVLFLNRLPTDSGRSPLRIAPLLQVTGAPSLTTPTERDLGSVRAALDRTIAVLQGAGTTQLSVRIDADMLAAMASSSDPEDQQRLADLAAALGDVQVLGTTWAPVNLEAWSNESFIPTLRNSRLTGAAAIQRLLNVEPESSVWGPDPTQGPAGLTAMATLGGSRLVVTSDQLSQTNESQGIGDGQRIVITNGSTNVEAFVLDPDVQQHLNADSGAVGALQALSELWAFWFAASAKRSPTFVVDLSAASSATTTAFLQLLNPESSFVTSSTLVDAFTSSSQATTGRRNVAVTRQLVVPQSVPDVKRAADRVTRLLDLSASYHSSIPDEVGQVPIDELLYGSMHRDLTASQRTDLLSAAQRRLSRDIRAIQGSADKQITATANRSTLPIQVDNGTNRTIKVQIRYRGPQFRFPNGRSVAETLKPGLNEFKVPIITQSSGRFRIIVELRTADGSLVLDRSTVSVNSTAFSGLGAAIGALSLVVLIIWWGRTILRTRRAKRAARLGDTAA